jgi:hypothetical protein
MRSEKRTFRIDSQSERPRTAFSRPEMPTRFRVRDASLPVGTGSELANTTRQALSYRVVFGWRYLPNVWNDIDYVA